MKIKNEIKLKVFGQYLGQVAQWKNLDYTDKFETETMWDNITYYIDNDAYLILKPLSAISDEDAVEVANIINVPKLTDTDMEMPKTDRVSIAKGYINQFQLSYPKRALEVYQFLQSKGYDLPQYLLGGKTLKECNLAIYE